MMSFTNMMHISKIAIPRSVLSFRFGTLYLFNTLESTINFARVYESSQ